MNVQKKYKALIFAPLANPVGGVSSIVAMLHESFVDRSDVNFISPLEKTNGLKSSLIRSIKNIFRLTSAIRETKIESKILLFSSHSASFYEKIFWSFYILLWRRKPVMLMVSGGFPKFWEELNSIACKFFIFLINRKSIVIAAQSESWLNYYSFIFPSADLKFVNATVSLDFFNQQRTDVLTKKSHNLLYVGWIIPEKGIFDLINAMVILVRKHPDVKLRLVGPLFDREDFWSREVNVRGISTNIEFLGAISNRQMLLKEFNSASIFIFPSHYEGFPVALLEALTVGLPCVATSVGGIPDILDYGSAGILVKPKTPSEITASLCKLINNTELREKISISASKRAREVYSFIKFSESFENLLSLKVDK